MTSVSLAVLAKANVPKEQFPKVKTSMLLTPSFVMTVEVVPNSVRLKQSFQATGNNSIVLKKNWE
jgi:hypothetical protein